MAVSGRSAPTAFHADQTVGLGDDLQVGLGAGPSLCLVRRLVGRGGVAVRVVPLDQLQVPLAYGGPIVAAIDAEYPVGGVAGRRDRLGATRRLAAA